MADWDAAPVDAVPRGAPQDLHRGAPGRRLVARDGARAAGPVARRALRRRGAPRGLGARRATGRSTSACASIARRRRRACTAPRTAARCASSVASSSPSPAPGLGGLGAAEEAALLAPLERIVATGRTLADEISAEFERVRRRRRRDDRLPAPALKRPLVERCRCGRSSSTAAPTSCASASALVGVGSFGGLSSRRSSSAVASTPDAAARALQDLRQLLLRQPPLARQRVDLVARPRGGVTRAAAFAASGIGIVSTFGGRPSPRRSAPLGVADGDRPRLAALGGIGGSGSFGLERAHGRLHDGAVVSSSPSRGGRNVRTDVSCRRRLRRGSRCGSRSACDSVRVAIVCADDVGIGIGTPGLVP